MDIRKLALVDTATLHVLNANDEPIYADEMMTKPALIHLYGPGSKQFAAAEARNNRRIMESMGKRGKKLDQAELRVDFLVSVTAGFENIEYDKLQGEALYRAVYSDTTLRFIADQVYAFVHEAGNFTKSSPTT